MSRHQAVKREIRKGQFDDSEEEYDEEENYDQYDDSNFSASELAAVRRIVNSFNNHFTRFQVIDALYETDGDEDAAFEKLQDQLAKDLEKKKKQEQKNKANQPKPQKQASHEEAIQQLQQQAVEEQKQQNTSSIQKKDYQIVFDVEKFNAPYPDIQYEHNIPPKYMNLVVVGHVDSGKSTLIGKLLHQLKVVDDREMHRAQNKKNQKDPIVFAFVTDEAQEEKDRLVTMDIGYKVLKVGDKFINLLDSPGHKDFVPNMIQGACQADYAILVIDSAVNAFESGFGSQGQAKEHAYLLRALGVKKLIVGINKMDLSKWDVKRFNYIRDVVKDFLLKIGYRDENLIFIPYSASQGENLSKRSQLPMAGWYEGPCIFEALSQFEIPERDDHKPARMTIQNCFQQFEGKIRGQILFGKVESGRIQKGEKYVILPQGIVCTVKEILEHDGKVKSACTGAIVDVQVQMKQDVEFQDIRSGEVMCSMEYPIPVSNLFLAEIVTLELDCPIIKGQMVIVHINGSKIPGVLKKLNKILDGKGNVKKLHPRTIGSSEQAEVEIETTQLVCLETFKNSNAYGKVILRHRMATLAVGKITQIKMYFEKLKATQTDRLRKNSNVEN